MTETGRCVLPKGVLALSVLCAAMAVGVSAHSQEEHGVVKHVVVYYEKGRFGGWPANHGIWSWGDEILVGFSRGYYKDQGPDRHHIDREKPEEHLLARSLDGGVTWAIEDPAEKGQLLPQGESLHGVELPGVHVPQPRACPGGIEFTHPDFAMTVRMSSVDAGQSRFYYSLNRGHDWEGPFLLPAFDTPGVAARTDYIVDGPEECMLFLTAAKSNKREGRPLVVQTSDGGATWNLLSLIGPEPEGFAIMPSAVRLSDTELYVAVRRREVSKRWMGAFRSLDNGKTWQPETDPVDNLGEGNPPSLIRLRDGRLCVTYGYRAAPFSIRARLSEDGGRTWGDQLVLRDDGLCRDIGYCRSVQRPDGKVVVVYYFCDEPTGPERYIGATLWTPPGI